jgi:signal transduction histidine kinase
VLLVSFSLTISCFSTAAVVSQWAERGIATSADGIASNAVPSVDHLAEARTALRRLEVALDEWSDRFTASGESREPAEVAADRQLLSDAWSAYLALPAFPGERELQDESIASLATLDRAIERLRRHIIDGDRVDLPRTVKEDLAPAIDRLDDDFSRTSSLNARNAAGLGGRIASIRRTSSVLALVLGLLSAAFAVIAAVYAIRIVRRYSSLMEHRMSEVERFSDRVAHDLRSPLTSVSLDIHLAQSKLAPGHGTHRHLERANRVVLRVGEMIEGLLAFAQAGRTEGATEVAMVIDDVIARVGPLAESRGIVIRSSVETCRAACSSGVLTSMVANLVDNAIKYMGESSVRHVSVEARCVSNRVTIEVTDTGAGVPSRLRGTLFLPYARGVDSSIPGIGLGLATVRRLAEAHGGSVGFDTPPEYGSRFWFTLPLA